MKRIAIAFLPLLLAGFVLRDDSCKQPVINTGDGSQVDGPYVLYGKGEKIYVQYIVEDSTGNKVLKFDSTEFANKQSLSLNVLTDQPGQTFNVSLKTKLENEKTEFNDVKKVFIVSDIEGNFGAFRKLLVAGSIIDSTFNWIFGDGHLVLTGDFVDRGMQQNEVLWLIYSLEEKAKAAGGYVHYVLGNHEIMNMSGDLRYLHPKYQQHAALMNQSFAYLYGPQSELGRWLRTKNVMEKIGDILFCHAGVSAPVNKMDIGTGCLNKAVRPYYGDSTGDFRNAETATLYGDNGPFWYRGYYYGIKANPSQVDSTLSIYNVKHIATGHTVIADTISILFNGKVINTDVHHVKGHTEGLLLDSGVYFRVKPTGEKFPVLNH